MEGSGVFTQAPFAADEGAAPDQVSPAQEVAKRRAFAAETRAVRQLIIASVNKIAIMPVMLPPSCDNEWG